MATAAAAASTKGIFRTEVTPLAVGAMRAQWGCTRLRMQDGALAHKLIEIAIASGQWMSAEFNSTWGVGSKRWLNASIACLRTATDDTTPLSQSAVIQDICTACAERRCTPRWAFGRALVRSASAADHEGEHEVPSASRRALAARACRAVVAS